jgi:hypothetical protein
VWAQAQQLVGFFLSARKCAYQLSILLQNASNICECKNKFVGIIITTFAVLALLQVQAHSHAAVFQMYHGDYDFKNK